MARAFIPQRIPLRVVSVLFALSIALAPSGPGHAMQAGSGARLLAAAQGETTGKVIVAFSRAGLTEAQAAAILARHGLQLEMWLPELGLARASAPTGTGAAPSALSALEEEQEVQYATQERRSVEVADTPNDEYWSEQWGPAKVGLPAARDLTWGDASVVIAVVDTGVSYFHWDLRDQVWINPGESEIDPVTGQRTCNTGIAKNGQDDDENGYTDDCRGFDFDSGTNDPTDVYGHGTVVAGIAGAATNNAGHYTNGKREGIAGMGGSSRVMALRAMDSSGFGSPFNIAEAIRYAADAGAKVINLSLTLGVIYNPDDASTLCKATDYAQAKGALVAGASGNHSSGGVQPVSYPAACTGVLAVGASTREDTRAFFSDAGSRLDLVAPGEGIFSTLKTTNTSYGRWGTTGNGTSFAAPHAAGAAALVRGLRPDLSAAQVISLLRNSADDVGDPGFDNLTGWGRLNAGRAAASALEGLALHLEADPPGVALSNSTTVRIQVTGPGGAPAGIGARVSLVSALGVVYPPVVTVDEAGIATATFTAGTSTGLGSVTAELGANRATVPITVSSGVPTSIHLTSEPPLLPTNGRGTITASVLDDGGNPISSVLDVTFAATLGTVDPLTAKTSAGKANTTFTAGPGSGVASIQAAAGALTASVDVPILGAGEPFTVTLATSPEITQAGGPEVTLTASVLDSSGQAAPDGTVVSFSTDLGTVAPATAATKTGLASVKLAPGTVAGTAHVTANAGLVQDRKVVTVVAGAPTNIVVDAAPTELVADYNQLATITAVAKDQYGNVAADGVVIQFNTTLGELVQSSAAMQGGHSQVQLVGGLVAGNAQITATAPGGAHASTSVTVQPNAPSQMAFAAQPSELTAGGGASRLRTTIKDAYGNLVRSGVPVTFTTDLGQLQPAGGGAGGTTLVALTNAGIAEVDLAPGTSAGIAQVHAAVSAELEQTIQITVRPAGAAQLVLSAQPMIVRPGSRVDIAAHVTDPFGNPVADGVTVTFGVSRGQLYQSMVPTVDGYAATWFAAPATVGPVQIVAVSGGVTGAPLTVQVARTGYLPFVNR